MKQDGRLSSVLHVLLHMAEIPGPVTSAALARMMGTHPVVTRRTMAGLRASGHVRSTKGHGGGWELACDFSATTLRDIYLALGSPSLFGIGNRSDSPQCLVERAVNDALGAALQAAEALLLERFGSISLAVLSRDFHRRLAKRGTARRQARAHG